MERAQTALVSVLLDRIHSLGLISDFAYWGAMDLVHSGLELPELFREPVRRTEEASELECAQGAQ